MDNNDLRVIKTKEGISSAFISLLRKKELRKITVTELAQKARISKATFYYHYEDIYQLFQSMMEEEIDRAISRTGDFGVLFDDPARFVLNIKEGFFLDDSGYSVLFYRTGPESYLSLIYSKIKKVMYSSGVITENKENNIKITMTIAALLHYASPKPENAAVPEDYTAELADILGKLWKGDPAVRDPQ